jgi:hypothetical protein
LAHTELSLLFVRVLLPWLAILLFAQKAESSLGMGPMFPSNDSLSAGRFPM